MLKVAALTFAVLVFVVGNGFGQGLDNGVPSTAPQAAPTASGERTLTLNLDQLLDLNIERGHAEFDSAMRREAWKNPMVRLEWGLQREQWAMRRGFIGGSGIPWGVSTSIAFQPGVNPKLVMKGPWAEDWHELTPEEKIGRLLETGAYAGLIIGLLHALHH
jgi:hypothetical protein